MQNLSEEIQQKFRDGLKSKVLFNHPCLQSGTATADSYFKEITYQVDLQLLLALYKVVDTCYYSDLMKYAPVLLEIKEQQIRESYDNHQYLIQVWNMTGSKIFEEPINRPPRLWAICYEYLVFLPGEGEENSDCVHIVNLEKNNNRVLVKNFALGTDVKYICYNGGSEDLKAATDYDIHIIQVATKLFDDKTTTLDAEEEKCRTIRPGLKIHSIFQNRYAFEQKYDVFAFETLDNQLEFDKITTSDFEDDQKFTYEAYRFRDLFPKKEFTVDPIVKNHFVLSKGFNYTISLRQSGRFDIYWNMFRKDSPSDIFAQDVGLTINSFYFKMENGDIMCLKHNDVSHINYEMASVISKDDVDFENLLLKRVNQIDKYLVNIYTGYQIVRNGESTTVVVSHDKFVSIYDLVTQRWTNHVKYPTNVINLIRIKKGVKKETVVLLADGALYNNVTSTLGQEPTPEDKFAEFKGQILSVCQDIQNNFFFYAITMQEEKVRLQILFKDKVHDCDMFENSKDNFNISCLQGKESTTHIVVQRGSKIAIYKHKEKVIDEDTIKPMLELVQSYPEFGQITGTIHQGAYYDIKYGFVLCDKQNLYAVKREEKTCTTYKGQNLIGLQFFNKSISYALCQEARGSNLTTGLRLLNLESILQENKGISTLLKHVEVGYQGQLEFSKTVSRLAFIKSFTHLVVTPILHRATNRFIGIQDTNDYLAYKVMGDKFMALNKQNVLLCWSLISGKLLSTHKLEKQDFSEYENYMDSLKKDKVLLKTKNQIEDYQLEEFYSDWQLRRSLQNQITSYDLRKEKIKSWKLIEIVNEKEVNEILVFNFPLAGYQKMFFSTDCSLMILKLNNQRAFIYERVSIKGESGAKVSWKMVKEINGIPEEINVSDSYIPYFSPDFSLNLSICKKRKQFVINDTFANVEICEIPKDLMPISKTETSLDIMSRFFWIDNDTVKLMNREGVEKIICISDKSFTELAFNSRQLIKEESWKNHLYYYRKPTIPTHLVFDRLQMKYQVYKSAYFLEGKRSQADLYEQLLTVDPTDFTFLEQSFTFYHWSLMEQLHKGEIMIEDVEPNVLQQMLLNILPGGNTILHKLFDKEDMLMKIFAVCHPQVQGAYTSKFHIPVLPNLEGQTALHYCRDHNDFKTLDTILKYLQLYDIDHHSRAIKDLIPTFVQKQLPEFLNYLDSRMLQNQQLSGITKGCLKEDSTGIIDSQLWFNMKDFDGKLFRHKPVETRIKCEFIDLPSIYHFNDEHFQDLFDELADTDDFQLFTKTPIQKVIEFNYGLVKEYTIKKLFIPFVVFQCLYVVFTNYIYPRQDLSTFWMTLEYSFLVMLALFATYFLSNEVKQLSRDGLEHLLSIWNYIDIIPPIGIYMIILIQIFESTFDQTTTRTILSITSFFMWFKFLYFLRIFNKTGYLIRMILEVIYDMRHFLLVLMITMVAFADSLLCISLANAEGDSQFIKSFPDALIYTYLLILGEFNVDEFGEVSVFLVWGLFLLCTVFNMIVMLNLLIAIISETFANVTSNAQNAAYQEMAAMIAENNYLVPERRMKTYAHPDRLLLVVTDLEHNKETFSDPVLDRIHDLKHELENQVQGLGKMFNLSLKTEFEEHVTLTNTEMKNLKQQLLLLASQEEIQKLNSSNQASFKKLFKKMKKLKKGNESSQSSDDGEPLEEAKVPALQEGKKAKKGASKLKGAMSRKKAAETMLGEELEKESQEDNLD